MTQTYAQRAIASLDERRAASKLSRKRWLRRAGVAESTFYRWASGQTSPRVETLGRLESALGDGR